MIEIKNVTFTYGSSDDAGTASSRTASIHDLSLSVPGGQFVVLCGESGCGKTTITRLVNGLIPHYYEGKLSGSIRVNGCDIARQSLYDTAKTVGSVFQDPRSQFFNVDTTSEITFGCENLGMPEETILRRLGETTEELGLRNLLDRSIFHLSGGEKQRIACAGVSVMEPEVLVLDEPSSNLDAQSVMDLRSILAKWKSEGRTVIISEHRLYYLHGLADRFVYIRNGRIERDMTADEFCSLPPEVRRSMGLRATDMQSLFHVSGSGSSPADAQRPESHSSGFSTSRPGPMSAPGSIDEGAAETEASCSDSLCSVSPGSGKPACGIRSIISTDPVVSPERKTTSCTYNADCHSETGRSMTLRDLRFSYKNRHPVLDITDCEIPAGRVTAIIGSNGAGKSTFARCFCGLEKRCGTVIYQGRKLRPKDRLNTCYMVLQDAGHQLFTESVLDEVLISLDRKDLHDSSFSYTDNTSPAPAESTLQDKQYDMYPAAAEPSPDQNTDSAAASSVGLAASLVQDKYDNEGHAVSDQISPAAASDFEPSDAAGSTQTTGKTTDSAVRKAEEILASLDLLQFKDRHPASLSGGQKQRLAIATSVASKRSILFFDEPTSGLDYRHMLETADLFRRLQASGHTIYVVTHDPEFIIECCTDIIHLEKGRITEQYTMNDIGAAKISRFFSCR